MISFQIGWVFLVKGNYLNVYEMGLVALLTSTVGLPCCRTTLQFIIAESFNSEDEVSVKYCCSHSDLTERSGCQGKDLCESFCPSCQLSKTTLQCLLRLGKSYVTVFN